MTDDYPVNSIWLDVHTLRVWLMTESGWEYKGISKSSDWCDVIDIAWKGL